MGKKHSKEAFNIYKLQFEAANKGKIFDKGITDTTVAALHSWNKMTLQQREPFEDLAKKAVPKMRTANKTKSSERDESSLADKNRTINEIVRRSFLNDTLTTQEYYFIAGNVFCQTMLNKYYPAELALIKFSLQDGVIQTFHTYINPENIPIGYRFDAITLSNETHQLPIPPKAKGEKNFALILEEIDKFIGSTQESILLFTLEENIPMIATIIQEFCAAANASTDRYEILSLNQLFLDLKQGGFESAEDAKNQLNQDKYMFLDEIACQFHKEIDCSKYCCLSAVKRWAYAISENICIDLNITLVAGKHFPIRVGSSVQLFQQDFNEESTLTTTSTKSRGQLLRNLALQNKDYDLQFHLNAAKYFTSGGKSDYDQEFHLNDASFCNSFNTLDGSQREQDLNSTVSTNFSELDRLREGSPLSSLYARGRRGRANFGQQNFGAEDFSRGRIGRGRGRSFQDSG